MAATDEPVAVVNPVVRVDPDIKTHMLRTYVSLRRCIAVVTFLFLAVLFG